MPWCPDCKVEYRDGCTVCSDCGSLLVDEYPENQTEDNPPAASDSVYPVLLTQVTDSIEADMLTAMLESEGIHTMREFKEAGGYLNLYMGKTVFGVDIYVSSEDIERARELFEEFFSDNPAAPIDETAENPHRYKISKISGSVNNSSPGRKSAGGGLTFASRKKIVKIVILAMLIPGILVFLIGSIIQLAAFFSIF